MGVSIVEIMSAWRAFVFGIALTGIVSYSSAMRSIE